MAVDHFDVIVVGSGFGGSVTACRMAEAGRSVCVLERGKAYPPHSFPRSPLGLSHNLWDPSEGLHGMLDLWSFAGLEALVSSGLGGGSLIYANVILRKDEKWFVKEDAGGGYEHWPVTRADLDPHYDRIEERLGVQKYPLDQDPYDKTAKTLAFRGAAKELDLDWFLPNLAVTFANKGQPARVGEPIEEPRENLHRTPRTTCQLVGECDVGCNYGAKNSLDYNYLTDAWHAGADIRTRSEVKGFEPRDGGGYSVHYVEHSAGSEGQKTDTGALPRTTLTCDRLVISAGTLGSPYLLMRNRSALPGISPLLGTRFSGNGDLLTFAMRCMQDGENGERIPRVLDPAHGPVITSAIRVPDELDGGGATGRGFYLEDAGYPEFLSWMLQATDLPGSLLRAAPILKDVILHRLGRQADTNLSAELQRMFGDCGISAGVLPLLGMGRDVPDGNMALADNGLLEVDWRKRGRSAEYFDRVREVSKQVCEKLGGTFLDNPIWHLNHVITVHPLGGCPMGESRERGVVDPVSGQVWGYEGLHVADGSVMPGPVGPNPSATIAALADRFADAVLEGRAPAQPRAAAAAATNGGAAPAAKPAGDAVALEFTEEMKGFLTFGEDDYDRAYRDGKRHRRRLMFRLTIKTDDVDRFIDDPGHVAGAEGYVRCDELGGERPVEHGIFNLFVDQEGHRDRKRMYYRLHFSDGEGHPLTLTGHKIVEDDPGFDVWSDTSTLFTTVLAGHVDEGGDDQAQVVARAILHILPLDFAQQLTTFRTDPGTRVDALARFGVLFAGDLWEVYARQAKEREQVPG
jgi:cholesterol oxidase